MKNDENEFIEIEYAGLGGCDCFKTQADQTMNASFLQMKKPRFVHFIEVVLAVHQSWHGVIRIAV